MMTPSALTTPVRRGAFRGAVRGFTLIEVVLAVTLSIMLIGAAMWFYRHAGEVRAELAAESNDISQRRQLLERITMDLRNAVALPGQAGALNGTTDRVTFITASLPGSSVWAEQKLTETPPPAEQDLRQVTYGLLYFEDDLGNREYVGIESQMQKLLSPKTAEVGKEIKATVLTNKYLFMRFQYWDGTTWQVEWQNQPTPPLAIEVVIGTEPLTEGGDPAQYDGPLIRRVIFLPSGAPTADGSVVQGIGGAP